MSKYLKIWKYNIIHKWYVMCECFRVGLYLQGLLHDWDKFIVPSMWIAYANFFYGGKQNPRDRTGYYKPWDTGNQAFEMAWHGHLHRNKHHWQWWIRHNDDGRTVTIPMEPNHRLEMVCDWVGAGKAQGFFSPKDDKFKETREWYKDNKNKMTLHKDTRAWVENYLGL